MNKKAATRLSLFTLLGALAASALLTSCDGGVPSDTTSGGTAGVAGESPQGGSAGSSGGSGGAAGANPQGGTAGTAGAPDCSMSPKTHEEIINACSDAEKVDKMPALPLLKPDGSLPPLP